MRVTATQAKTERKRQGKFVSSAENLAGKPAKSGVAPYLTRLKRLFDLLQRSRKLLDRLAQSRDLDVRYHTSCQMSAKTPPAVRLQLLYRFAPDNL